MGSFGGGLESIGYEFDPRSILQGVARVNEDFEKMEKTGGKVADNLKRDWGGIAESATARRTRPTPTSVRSNARLQRQEKPAWTN
jgi:hypothetical protein